MAAPPKHCGSPPDELAERRARLAQVDEHAQARTAIQQRALDTLVAMHVEMTGEPATSCACGGVWIDGVHVQVNVDDDVEDPSQFVVCTTTKQYVDKGHGLNAHFDATIKR